MAAARMYSSLADIWHGWSRIYYSAFGGSLVKLLVGVLLLVAFTMLPYLALIYAAVGLLWGVADAAALWVLLVLCIVQIAVMQTLMVRLHLMTRCEPGYVVMHFPASFVALGILFSSIRKRFSSRGIVWKGTRYDARGNQHVEGASS